MSLVYRVTFCTYYPRHHRSPRRAVVPAAHVRIRRTLQIFIKHLFLFCFLPAAPHERLLEMFVFVYGHFR